MKRLTFLFLAGCLLFSIPAKSQDTNTGIATVPSRVPQELKDVLKESMADFDSAKNMNEWISASNHLGLVARKYNDQWAANYYACYTLTVLSYIEKDSKKKDGYLDDAEVFLNKAIEDYKSEYVELYILNAMFDNARLAAQPAMRYKKFGDLFNENIEKAKLLQPDNPRIYYLKGNSTYYTPKMFGGGAKNALPLFEKAETLFMNESKDDIFKPYWGQKQNEEMLAKCRNELK